MQHATNRITISFVLIYPALFRLIPWFPTFCVLRGRQQLADISSRTHKHTNVNVSVLSGKITLDGFISEKSKYSLTSGKITSLNAGGGELYTNVTSGSLTLGCAEKITGIDAKVAGGKAHISIPKDTGAQVTYSVASGSIKIGLDGRNEKLTGSGSISYGNAEANINVNVASGSFILDTYTLSE